MYRDATEWQYNNKVRCFHREKCAGVTWKKQPEHFMYTRTFANDIFRAFGSTWIYWEAFSAMNSAKVDFVPSYWWSLARFTTHFFLYILSRNSQVDRNTQLTNSHWKFLRKIIMSLLKFLFNEMRLTRLYLVVNMWYLSGPRYEFRSYMQPASGKSLPIPFVMEKQPNNQHVVFSLIVSLLCRCKVLCAWHVQ
jgi:hypothetical protein